MSKIVRLIPASDQFWHACAVQFLSQFRQEALAPDLFSEVVSHTPKDFSSVHVIVPTYEHAQLFLRALSQTLGSHFIPPRIMTMFAWIGMQPPSDIAVSANSERLMSLYGELRQHGWLKQLFGAKRNTDLLPLAQTLLGLSDELTQAWLPTAVQQPQGLETVWLEALSQLTLPVQKMVSDETKLVWTLWQSQLDHHDKNFQEFAQMMQLAADASDPLIWISPTMPSAIEEAFLTAYATRQSVQIISIDWRKAVIPLAMCSPWPGLLADETQFDPSTSVPAFDWQRLRLCEVASLEEEAEQAAQCIVNWLQDGKQNIAVIAQDRVVSRRLRALLERAQVFVADETGWKLSTTRAAAALAAWFEVVTSRADTIALLDFLKSPFLMPEDAIEDKADLVMEIELALRRANVLGTWDAVLYALENQAQARQWIVQIARLAHSYSGSISSATRSIKDWASVSLQTLTELGMQAYLQEDLAGQQVLQMLQALTSDCQGLASSFSFSEWRAFINLQLESTPFTLAHSDKRVVMLPLNGARLRSFDAVYLIGGDAKHLPSRAQETLFFTNAVRRECGLVTREQRQQQQLRDFAELILSNGDIVLSWQSQHNGEFNAVSPWIAQLTLYLTRHGLAALVNFKLPLSTRNLIADLHSQPRPSAVALLPASLSASGLSSLIACPYQFFAGRMLKLSAIDELSDMPEKRDYGDWLHAILNVYHARLKGENIALSADRVGVLEEISNKWFARVLRQSPAALGYSMRWRKVIPAYVQWANAREETGWQFAFGEVWAEHTLTWDGGEIGLRGRIDRIDERILENGDVERAVLDYKTKTKSALKTRLTSFEDQQLPFYGLLSRLSLSSGEVIDSFAPVDSASYVALELEREKLGEVEANEFAAWKIELEKAITLNMQAIQNGASLPAQGVESVCQYCEMRGLCRKGAW